MNQAPAIAAVTASVDATVIPDVAPVDNEALAVLVLAGKWPSSLALGVFEVVGFEDSEVVAPDVRTAAMTLNPLTCIPQTIDGPVVDAVDAATTVVATPQGPDGVVDSYVIVWLGVKDDMHCDGKLP